MDAPINGTEDELVYDEDEGENVPDMEEFLRDIPIGDLIAYIESTITDAELEFLDEPYLWPPANPLQTGSSGELNGDPNGPTNTSDQMQLAEEENQENREREANRCAMDRHEWE